MEKTKAEDEKVEVNFESHPPIQDDIVGITNLLRQTFLSFVDCSVLAQYLIDLKDVTQVIALEPVEENSNDEDEVDDDIYGVTSVVNLKLNDDENKSLENRKKLLKFLQEKCPKISSLTMENSGVKLGLIVNERYTNLPPQLSLPTFNHLTEHLDKHRYTHLIFLCKIFIKSRSSNTDLPSKKPKTSSKKSDSGSSLAEPLIFANSEEEIIFENSEEHADFDVSHLCDENGSWSYGSDVKYIPHRRILIIDYNKWPEIMKSLEKELSEMKDEK